MKMCVVAAVSAPWTHHPPQATCTHVRLSAEVGGDDTLTEDSANELVSVLQVRILLASRPGRY